MHTLYVPGARAIHHEQLSNDTESGSRRVVEFHRNRDLYMRKHHGPAAAAAVRALTAFSYLPRALAAVVLPGHDPRWYLLHARQAWSPNGEGIREAAEAYNAGLGRGWVPLAPSVGAGVDLGLAVRGGGERRGAGHWGGFGVAGTHNPPQ